MRPGMTFTIEPVRSFVLDSLAQCRVIYVYVQMINLGHWDLEHWPDDWTAVTIDGKRSAQFEETLL